ncbi:MAG: TerB family tellurite resistance protein [Marinoscillum sp.]
MSTNQLSILIKLAKSDGEIDASEEALIKKIGFAHGMSDSDIVALVKYPVEQIDF